MNTLRTAHSGKVLHRIPIVGTYAVGVTSCHNVALASCPYTRKQPRTYWLQGTNVTANGRFIRTRSRTNLSNFGSQGGARTIGINTRDVLSDNLTIMNS